MREQMNLALFHSKVDDAGASGCRGAAGQDQELKGPVGAPQGGPRALSGARSAATPCRRAAGPRPASSLSAAHLLESPEMGTDRIIIAGAREHNLKDISLSLPRDKFIVITGLSGSGKSSLAFDTIYAEGQRRYVESLSAYARQFLGQMNKPDVDSIEGSVAGHLHRPEDHLAQPALHRGHGHRGLRLPAAALRPHRPSALLDLRPAHRGAEQGADRRPDPGAGARHPVRHQGAGGAQPEGLAQGDHRAHPPGGLHPGGDRRQAVHHGRGVARARQEHPARHQHRGRPPGDEGGHPPPAVGLGGDRPGRGARACSIVDVYDQNPVATGLGRGEPTSLLFSENLACPEHGVSLPEMAPRIFSFNSPHGACETCSGLGFRREIDPLLIIADPQAVGQGGRHPALERQQFQVLRPDHEGHRRALRGRPRTSPGANCPRRCATSSCTAPRASVFTCRTSTGPGSSAAT